MIVKYILSLMNPALIMTGIILIGRPQTPRLVLGYSLIYLAGVIVGANFIKTNHKE